MDVASVHSQQLEKKIKQFDKVWIEPGDEGDDDDDDDDENDDDDDGVDDDDDVASVHSQQLEKKNKQFDKVNSKIFMIIRHDGICIWACVFDIWDGVCGQPDLFFYRVSNQHLLYLCRFQLQLSLSFFFFQSTILILLS